MSVEAPRHGTLKWPLTHSAYCQSWVQETTLFSMQPFPEKMIEIGMIVAGVVGLLILIAPNFGLKPKATVDGGASR